VKVQTMATWGRNIAGNPDNRVSRLGKSYTPQPLQARAFQKITTENLKGKQNLAPHSANARQAPSAGTGAFPACADNSPAKRAINQENTTMVKFEIITGKALKSAIAGRGQQIATFTQREHQLAVSALAHLGEHNDVIYVQALYDMSPANYQRGLRLWFLEFGKCTFKANESGKGGVFVYAKSKPSNVEGAMEIAPANFERASKEASTEPKAFSVSDYLAKVVEKLQKEDADIRVIRAIEGALKVASGPVVVVRNQKPLPVVAEKKAAPKKADPMQAPAANSVAA
jgi:hypothetical protein